MKPNDYPLQTFNRLLGQVDDLGIVAKGLDDSGNYRSASAIRRSAYLLTVAAFDTYFHESAINLLVSNADRGARQQQKISQYFGGSISTGSLTNGSDARSHIRLQLSFKTLVAPAKIDKMLQAADIDPDSVWLQIAFQQVSRPDRVRRLVEVLYDRRNQIAHEGDWDIGRLDFRPMDKSHLEECRDAVRGIIEGFETFLESNLPRLAPEESSSNSP